MAQIIGLLLFLLLVAVGIGFGNIRPMLDYPSAQLILGSIFTCYLMAFNLNKIPPAILGIITSKFKNSEEQKNAIYFAQIGFWASLLSGILGTTISLILLLIAKDWKNELLGVNLAISLIPLVYSTILSILFICGRYRAIRGVVLSEND